MNCGRQTYCEKEKLLKATALKKISHTFLEGLKELLDDGAR